MISFPVYYSFNPSSANPKKWSNTLKQFVGKLPTNCLSVFNHLVKLALKMLSNYADDNKLYAIDINKEETERLLVEDFQTVIDWFYESYMILNTGKCHYMCMGKDVQISSQ